MKNILIVLALGLTVSQAIAHVTVKPAEVKVASYQTFTVSVPVEKDVPTTGIRLIIPEGVNGVTPNVKPGWKIETKKATVDGEEKVTEIIWSNGTVPAGLRDEFLFSAKTPAEEGKLAWKAYQTYSDGSVVSWDVVGAGHDEDMAEDTGPASVTNVVDATDKKGGLAGIALPVSVIALLASLYTLYIVRAKKQ